MADLTRMIVEFGENLALLIALTFLYSFIIRKLSNVPALLSTLLQGALFGGIAVIGMQIPMHVAEGIIVDGRTVIVMLASPFAGPMAGVVAAVIVSGYRYYLGGIGVTAGIGAIVTAAAVGIVFVRFYSGKPGLIRLKHLLVMSAIMTILSLSWVFALPSGIDPWPILQRLLVPVGIMYPLAAILLGLMLAHEHRRLDLVEALKSSEERFRDFSLSASDWLWETDAEGRICWESDVSAALAGRSVQSVLGRTREEIAGELAGENDWSPYRRALEERKEFKDFEYAYPDLEGSIRYARINGKPLFDDQGRYLGHRGVATNITEVKEAEHSLRRAQRIDAVGRLTGGIAHDFNNLLAVIIGNAELLGDFVEDKPELRKLVDAQISAGEKGASLTDRLLAFSRQQALSPQTTDIPELIDGLEDLLQRSLGETIRLEVRHEAGVWPALIDPSQLEHALVNLAVNARDAMPTGGRLTIETGNTVLDDTFADQHEEVVPGPYVVISVSDDGTGMDTDTQERAFEPYYTTKDVGAGTGLGLSMVYGFAKQSNGHVSVYSEIGQGTTVRLFLPSSDESVDTGAVAKLTEGAHTGHERILVVEDDPSVRAIPVSILRHQGYEVVEAADAKDAMEKLTKEQRFDLLFTDVILPDGVDGVAIAREAVRLHPGIKVLYTTGYSENVVVHRGKLDDGIDLVNKPYRRADLIEKIRRTLDAG